MSRRLILSLGLGLLLLGCGIPKQALKGDYSDYNNVIQYNQSQQMLLNIVRLKYRESPLFLKVGALSASYSFEVSGGVDLGRAGNTNLYGVDFGSSYSTRPTITYTPVEGDSFVKQVLSEIDFEAFLLLFRSGWPISTLGHVLVERIGQYVNNPEHPTYPEFNKIVDVLREAQKDDKLKFDREHHEGEEGDLITLVVVTDRVDLLKDERVAAERELRFPIKSVQLRSFLDVLFSLGKNAEVPAEHGDQVRDSPGNGWMRIRSSSDRLDDSMVAVKHNGYWFSIANNDIQSKDTFALVKLLYQMQAGDIPTVQPLLTLPIAQP